MLLHRLKRPNDLIPPPDVDPTTEIPRTLYPAELEGATYGVLLKLEDLELAITQVRTSDAGWAFRVEVFAPNHLHGVGADHEEDGVLFFRTIDDEPLVPKIIPDTGAIPYVPTDRCLAMRDGRSCFLAAGHDEGETRTGHSFSQRGDRR